MPFRNYAEKTTVLPLLDSYAYHKGNLKTRKKWQLAKIFDTPAKAAAKKSRKK